MTGVLKSAEAGAIVDAPDFRPVRTAAPATTPVPDVESERLKNEAIRLGEKIESLEARLVEAEKSREAAFEEGRQAGLEAAESDEKARTELFGSVAGKSIAALEEQLAVLEPLAAAIARKCLAKLFGREDWRRDIVAELIAGQAKRLGNQAIIRIDVSAADFESTAALREALGPSLCERAELRVDEAMESGGCHLALELGGIDIGLDPQWTRLERQLGEISFPDEPTGGTER